MTTSDKLASPTPCACTPPTTPVSPLAAIDWQGALRSVLGSAVTAGVVTGGIFMLSHWIEEERARAASRATATTGSRVPFDFPDVGNLFAVDDEPDEHAAAAKLLGVDIDASADAIRAALRERMTEARRHPDQGGDVEAAKELIAAKNLLIERARRPGGL